MTGDALLSVTSGPRSHPWPSASLTSPATRRLLGDVGLAVTLAAVAAWIDVGGSDHQPLTAVWWDLALAAPLVLRRWTPTTSAALVGLVCLAQWHWWRPVFGDLAVLVALYTLAAYGRRAMLVLAVVTAELGVGMAVTRWAAADRWFLPTLSLTGTVTASWVLGIYVRTHRAWTTALRERAETAERERDHLARVAVAAERARISRELHDVVAHSISIMITLNDAAAAVGTPGEARDTVQQASEVGRHALEEMSRLLGVLREDSGETPGDYAPQPTTGQLSSLVELVRSAGLSVELHTSGDLATVGPSLQLAIYRIVQESLTNVLKHGRNVTRVDVAVARSGERVELAVLDDGETGPEAPVSGDHSMGLVGMRERASLFGGTVTAGPGPGGGLAGAHDSRRLGHGHRAASPRMTIRLLLADDQPLLLHGFSMILNAQPDLEVVGVAADGAEAISMSAALAPDVVLMDVRMPGLDGIAATRALTSDVDGPKVLVLTTFDLDSYAVEAVKAGASGFLLKNARPEELMAGIRAVASGDAVLAPSTTRRMLHLLADGSGSAQDTPSLRDSTALIALTSREQDVFHGLAAGLSNAEIALELVLAETTVKTHVTRILGKLQLRDRVQAVIYAYEHGVSSRAHPTAGSPPGGRP